MDFGALFVGMFIGFAMGCLFWEWLYAPSEMDR